MASNAILVHQSPVVVTKGPMGKHKRSAVKRGDSRGDVGVGSVAAPILRDDELVGFPGGGLPAIMSGVRRLCGGFWESCGGQLVWVCVSDSWTVLPPIPAQTPVPILHHY
jgi:hypothetical protein